MIKLSHINKAYKTGKVSVNALSDVSLSISTGEFVAIMGPSGSGKSTLLHIIGLLDRPTTGIYKLCNQKATSLTTSQSARLRNYLFGFVFQQFFLLPRMSIAHNVQLPRIYAAKRNYSRTIPDTVASVGLAERMQHNPNELSGGEQQRAAIARALINEPPVILADEPTGNLDSKNAEEIMSLLEHLHRQGHTIILVTHEEYLAQHAQRIISMHDGRIVSDTQTAPSSQKTRPQPNTNLDTIIHGSAIRITELKDYFKQAFLSIASHKLRSFLSMLGILIGVTAIISMLAVAQGAKDEITERISFLGTNLLMIRPGSSFSHGVALESGTVTRLTLDDAEAIARLPEVTQTSGSIWSSVQLVYKDKNWNTRMRGEGVNYQYIHSVKPMLGRFFTDEEVRLRKRVVVLGTTVTRELFGDDNPIGEFIRIERHSFRVIGVHPELGSSSWHDRDDFVVVPITTALHRILGRKFIFSIDAQIKDDSLIEQAERSIRNLLARRHRLSEEDAALFQIRNLSQIQDLMNQSTKVMTVLLGTIASISLLVGGIGIMNIMLVSVAERTREIGIRKAIGAQERDILLQFLIESAVLTCAGGFAGIFFGDRIAYLISLLADWPATVSLQSVLLAFGFSVGIGLVFGIMPARKASRLNPITALRYE